MFTKNIAFLEENGTHYLELTENNGDRLQFIGKDKEGNKFFLADNEEPRIISNEVDFDSAKNINPDIVQAIFCFGIVSIDEILQLAQHAHPESVFFLIETNFSLLQYALNEEDFIKLNKLNVMLIANGIECFEEPMKKISSSRLILLLRRPVFYFNSYYRNYEQKSLLPYIRKLRDVVCHKSFRIGNSIHDSLIGLIHNMVNIQHLNNYPRIAALENVFSNAPAFIIAAGPSLDKNIEHLKKIGDKGVIIAVDAIVGKLRKKGIVPHFIASVERVDVWELLVNNKQELFQESYLVGPLALQPEVVRTFGGKVILPLRQSVREYIWLSRLLGLEENDKIWMGASCAHVALGLAVHIGANPIVLVGQDLAFGDDMTTHAAGTVHDEKPLDIPDEVIEVEGYYGEKVKTQSIWNDFRIMFEEYIAQGDIIVLNATEGGVRIQGASQITLEEAVATYCKPESPSIDVYSKVEKLERNSIDWSNVEKNLKQYVDKLEKISQESLEQLNILQSILDNWDDEVAQRGLAKIYQQMKKTEVFFQYIPQDELVYHNLQGPIVVLLQKFQLIENNEKEQSLKENLLVQIEFCKMFSDTLWLIAQVILENFKWTEKAEIK